MLILTDLGLKPVKSLAEYITLAQSLEPNQ